MRVNPKNYGWAPEDPRDWPAGCSAHRDGWVRWYKNKTRFVCSKLTPIADVEDIWIALKHEIDGEGSGRTFARHRTYRQVLSEFLAAMEHRHKTGKPKPLSARMLHNYSVELNKFGSFVFEGFSVADREIGDANSPSIFAAYAQKFGAWKSSGYDSIISRVGALFNWAAEMEYIDRYRPGPTFQRPAKSEIRDDRIDLAKSFTVDEIAKMLLAANLTQTCWIYLGVCAGFTNSDVSTVTRSVIDLDTGVIDFRRKKTGKVRRVIPLPSEVVAKLKSYVRPEPASPEYADTFFLTTNGTPYSISKESGPSSTLNRLFRKLMISAGVPLVLNRSFTGLRTTFYNLAPKSAEWMLERQIVMGRAKGTVDLDHYLEDVGLDRVRHVVNHVWNQVSTSLADAKASLAASASLVAPAQVVDTAAPKSSSPLR